MITNLAIQVVKEAYPDRKLSVTSLLATSSENLTQTRLGTR